MLKIEHFFLKCVSDSWNKKEFTILMCTYLVLKCFLNVRRLIPENLTSDTTFTNISWTNCDYLSFPHTQSCTWYNNTSVST